MMEDYDAELPDDPMTWLAENLLPVLRPPSAVDRLAAVVDPDGTAAARVREHDTFPGRFRAEVENAPWLPDTLIDPILSNVIDSILKLHSDGLRVGTSIAVAGSGTGRRP